MNKVYVLMGSQGWWSDEPFKGGGPKLVWPMMVFLSEVEAEIFMDKLWEIICDFNNKIEYLSEGSGKYVESRGLLEKELLQKFAGFNIDLSWLRDFDHLSVHIAEVSLNENSNS